MPKLDVPTRKIPEKECAARFEHPHAFGYPALTPLEVLVILERVVESVAVIFAQIKRWIGEDQVYALSAHLRQNAETICVVQLTQIGFEYRFHSIILA